MRLSLSAPGSQVGPSLPKGKLEGFVEEVALSWALKLEQSISVAKEGRRESWKSPSLLPPNFT